jgi:hypothetical protein
MDGQRVYSDPKNQDSSMDRPLNDTMGTIELDFAYQIYVKDLFVSVHCRMGKLTMWMMMIYNHITNILVL